MSKKCFVLRLTGWKSDKNRHQPHVMPTNNVQISQPITGRLFTNVNIFLFNSRGNQHEELQIFKIWYTCHEMQTYITKLQNTGTRRRVALARNDVSDESVASIIRVRRISEVGTILAVTSNCSTLRRNVHCMRKEAIEWDVLNEGREGDFLYCVFLLLWRYSR
jgi:hypothetical protein